MTCTLTFHDMAPLVKLWSATPIVRDTARNLSPVCLSSTKGQACIGLMADSLSRIISYRSDPSQLFHHPHHDRRTTVLTPGCLNTQRRIPVEQGYDVEALSRLGLDSTGIEVSSKAVEAANIWLETQGSPKNESDGMTQRNQAKKEVELGDFFTWDQAGSRGGYDVFYDYT